MIRGDRWWHEPGETAPGPSPWHVCARPSCGLVWRSLRFIDLVEPAHCPMCGDRDLQAHGRRLSRLTARALRVAAAWEQVMTAAPVTTRRRAA